MVDSNAEIRELTFQNKFDNANAARERERERDMERERERETETERERETERETGIEIQQTLTFINTPQRETFWHHVMTIATMFLFWSSDSVI